MVARSFRRCSAAVLFAAVLLAVLAVSPRTAQAQAEATAVKSIGLSVFGAATFLNPKFGSTTGEIGYAVGGDITRHFRIVDISFEARYTSATGFSADEATYGGGFKFERRFNRFHPYVDFLVASGTIKFDHPEIYGSTTYTHDNSFVYDFGGGVDYDVVRNFGREGSTCRGSAGRLAWRGLPSTPTTRPWALSTASPSAISAGVRRYLRGARTRKVPAPKVHCHPERSLAAFAKRSRRTCVSARRKAGPGGNADPSTLKARWSHAFLRSGMTMAFQASPFPGWFFPG